MNAPHALVCTIDRDVDNWVLVDITEKETRLDDQLLGLEP